MMDPTPVLDELRGTVARAPYHPIRYRVDADGRKYVDFPPDLIAVAAAADSRLQGF